MPKNDNISDFFKRLRELLVVLDLNQKDLSDLTGIDQRTISRWRNENNPPGEGSLFKISKATGCNFDWLDSGKGEMLKDEKNTTTYETKTKTPTHTTKEEGYTPLLDESSRNYIDKKEARSTIVEKMDTIITFLEETYGDLPAMLDECLNQMKIDLRNTNPDFRQWEYDQQDKLLTRRKKLPEQGDNDPRILKQKTANGS